METGKVCSLFLIINAISPYVEQVQSVDHVSKHGDNRSPCGAGRYVHHLFHSGSQVHRCPNYHFISGVEQAHKLGWEWW
jgi:hypothetical protein